MPQLMNITRSDSSRIFAAFMQDISYRELRGIIEKDLGGVVTNFISDGVVEAWLDFSFKGQAISANNQFGEFWFFVRDPKCSEEILREIVDCLSRKLVAAKMGANQQ